MRYITYVKWDEFKGVGKIVQRNYLKSQHGLTLVEVLVSILILSIIVVTFLTFFLQSTKMTNTSEEVLDGSYVAQNQIEKIYFKSETDSYQTFIEAVRLESTNYQSSNGVETMMSEQDGYKIETEIEPAKNNNNQTIDDLYAVLVKVFNQSNQLKAQMETKIVIDEQADE